MHASAAAAGISPARAAPVAAEGVREAPGRAWLAGVLPDVGLRAAPPAGAAAVGAGGPAVPPGLARRALELPPARELSGVAERQRGRALRDEWGDERGVRKKNASILYEISIYNGSAYNKPEP